MIVSSDDIRARMEELPPETREFFFGVPFALRNLEIFKKHGITDPAAQAKLVQIQREIIAKALPVLEFPQELQARLGLSPEKTKTLALAIAKDQFLPAANYLGDVAALVRSLSPKPTKQISDAEVERELSHIKKQVLPQILRGEATQVPLLITDATKNLIEKIGRLVAPDSAPRLQTAIISRLRGVRDEVETKELLGRPTAAGGLGLAGAALQQVIDPLEDAYKKIHEAMTETHAQEKTAWVKAAREEQDMRAVARDAEEAASRDAAFAGVVGKSKKIQTSPAKAGGYQTKGSRGLQPAQPTVSMVASGGRPQLHDVKTAHKLVGPIEELELMTLEHFRKLSSRPSDAAARVAQKIELLRAESFAQRNLAIKAWQKSPIVSLYKEVTSASLTSGKPVPVVLAERAQSGKPAFSQDEFNAIMELNRALRF